MLPDTIYFAKEENQIMSTITMALVAVAIGLASAGAAARNGSDNGSTFRVSQYCVPQDDIAGAQTLYC
jgi:hypothetical protein